LSSKEQKKKTKGSEQGHKANAAAEKNDENSGGRRWGGPSAGQQRSASIKEDWKRKADTVGIN